MVLVRLLLYTSLSALALAPGRLALGPAPPVCPHCASLCERDMCTFSSTTRGRTRSTLTLGAPRWGPVEVTGRADEASGVVAWGRWIGRSWGRGSEFGAGARTREGVKARRPGVKKGARVRARPGCEGAARG